MAKDADDDLLEIYALLFDAGWVASRRARERSVTTAEILAYAKRGGADNPADFRLEKSIRRNVEARRIYLQAVRGRSLAVSHLAAAAGCGVIARRRLECGELEIVEDGGQHFLVLRLDKVSAAPRALEVRGEKGEGGRIPLPAPVVGVIQRGLGGKRADEREILELLLHRPRASIYLLP